MAQKRIIYSELSKIVKDNKKADYNKALKQIRGADPSFMKKSARYASQKLTPAQKGAITKKAKSLDKEIKGTYGRDLYTPSKKKGESKKAFNTRLNDLKAQYGQGGLQARGVYMEPNETDKGGKTKYRLNKEGKIETRFKTSRGTTLKNEMIPPSEFAPNEENLFDDVMTAFEAGLKWKKDPLSVSVMILGRRSNIAAAFSDLYGGGFFGELLPKGFVKQPDEDFILQFVEEILEELTQYNKDNKTGLYTGLLLEGEE
jgi:hypothetical protein